VPIAQGRANALVATLWKHVRAEKGHEEEAAGMSVNAADLLPANRGYYTFEARSPRRRAARACAGSSSRRRLPCLRARSRRSRSCIR
jgi:hypothetical protein